MKDYVELFKALSDENRLKILCMLACGELCACDIQDSLELTQPTISHHMKILQQVGLIEVEKRGKWAFYSIRQDQVDQLCDFIKSVTSEAPGKEEFRNRCSCSRSRCICD
ncbi:ArsR/SmtB family transcription factor [Geosporobacter subterraneus]|uniref:ArsR/SmtB family transcription factor n=1 Tax=Geosporobacter subterraneus TaxID=390806 RepID=UPI000DA5EE6C|nr:metalloregulator ArsR/SmtB family transcription factor [Geosporobacter subterraneus]